MAANVTAHAQLTSPEENTEHVEYFGKDVPRPVTGHLPILCNGDGLSIERMVYAKRGRSNDGDMVQGLQHLVESPQEFHKEMILLQVIVCGLFSFKSLQYHHDHGHCNKFRGYHPRVRA